MLVTGGSGVVGSALLPALAGRHAVTALRRLRPVGPCDAWVVGDVTKPLLGLDPPAYRRLCRDVDVVAHCAAMTKFSRRADHDGVNVTGTSEILRFAADARAAVVAVSTAFVAEGVSSVQEPSGYEESKRKAEQLMRDAPVPTVIVRPSVVAGHSRTGAIGELQGLHFVLAGLLLGQIPVLPGEREGLIDFVPSDLVAAALAGIVDTDPAAWPDTVWVTQGAGALKNAGLVETVQAFGARQGLALDPVKFMPYERIERLFLPVFLPELPDQQRRHFRALLRYARYINIERAFPAMSDSDARRFGVDPSPRPAKVLERNLAFLWDTHLSDRDATA